MSKTHLEKGGGVGGEVHQDVEGCRSGEDLGAKVPNMLTKIFINQDINQSKKIAILAWYNHICLT